MHRLWWDDGKDHSHDGKYKNGTTIPLIDILQGAVGKCQRLVLPLQGITDIFQRRSWCLHSFMQSGQGKNLFQEKIKLQGFFDREDLPKVLVR